MSSVSTGRLLQRSPGADVDAVLWEAHRAALNMRMRRISENSLIIPAGAGAFIAEFLAAHDLDTGNEHMLHLQARTWLHRDQLFEEQTPIAVSKTVGERLGDNLLLPLPLRHLFTVAAEIEAEIAKTG